MNKPPTTLLCISSDIPNLDTDAILRECPNLPAYEVWDVAIEAKRPGYWERFIGYCRIRGIKEIYCNSLISLGRGSIRDILTTLATLRDMKIAVHILELEKLPPSLTLLALRGWEIQVKSLAQSASLARARAEGSRVGRPPKELDGAKIRQLSAMGNSSRDIAEKLGISHATVLRRLEAMKTSGVIPQTDGL